MKIVKMEKKIVYDDVTERTFWHNVKIKVDNKSLVCSVSVDYMTNPEIRQVSHIEYLEGSQDFTEEELNEIHKWLITEF